MPESKRLLPITHYSDVLCVWAYVSEARLDEVRKNFAGQVALESRFVNVFGHARHKLEASWADRGGLAAYGDHVRGVVDRFGHVSLHEDVWSKTAPQSSLSAHSFLCAVRCLARNGTIEGTPQEALERAAWAMRLAFFAEARDISDARVHHELCEQLDIPVAAFDACTASGRALAELSIDLGAAKDAGIHVSPTLSLHEGRQRLTGNVGYRVIEANIRELLSTEHADGMSWC